ARVCTHACGMPFLRNWGHIRDVATRAPTGRPIAGRGVNPCEHGMGDAESCRDDIISCMGCHTSVMCCSFGTGDIAFYFHIERISQSQQKIASLVIKGG
ncbi:MAG: hypothetical protein J6Y37_14685, partial [Paludibacteraceae bacterium]|nr:hypothetical protein [Paludibacteraceae bacterium]